MMSKTETSSFESDDEMNSLEIVNRSVRRASVIAGTGLLLLAVLGAYGNFAVLENLVTRGDAAQTVNDIANSEGQFRLGIVSLFLVAVLDVVVAWALLTVFGPVNRKLSLLAAWCRVVYAGVFLVAISRLVGGLHLVNDASYLAAFSTEQLHAQVLLEINTFYQIWDAGFILFGLHLLLLGYLVYRSAYAPKFLGVLLVLSGLGYAIDSLGPVLSAGYTVELAMFTFIGEIVLIFWLLIKGRRIALDEASASTAK